jgi:hypothetical protein
MENLIEAYLNGELQSKERERFEKELIINDDLRQAVEHQRQLMEAFEHIRIKKSVQQAMHQTEKLAWKRRLLVAVLVLSLLGGVSVFAVWLSRRIPNGELSSMGKIELDTANLENKNFVPTIDSTLLMEQLKARDSAALSKNRQMAQDPDGAPLSGQDNQSVVRGDASDATVDEAVLKDFDAFFIQFPPVFPETGSFKKEVAAVKNCPACAATLQLLAKREAIAAQNDTLQYLEALSLLQRHQPQSAASKLYALNRTESPFRQEAQWLLGLAYFLQGKEAAQKTMEMIANDKAHSRREEAAVVLKKLE